MVETGARKEAKAIESWCEFGAMLKPKVTKCCAAVYPGNAGANL
jgi:hypothetical protein